ncbi:interleukin-18 receptor 1-like [Seriola aureovittata]|uniref:interleukin-18 receptor 1-like n=1 Tax=Seriola aureovittata TaxID=2871759 RepID=UPI0024BDD0A2|nr:interleukin-18 receptor 1-like [Seriola aureovittata]
MVVKVLLVPLLFLFTSKPGACHLTLKEQYVRRGEMVLLQCPSTCNQKGDAKVIWSSYTAQKMDLTNMSSAEQKQMGVLVHQNSLVILSASVDHQGNYSCSVGNASCQFRFMLTENTPKSKEYEERNMHNKSCHTQESCKLNCPDVTIPPNITRNGITWHKEGEAKDDYFQTVEEKDKGVYTCTRSYLYLGQIYNKTFTVKLQIKPKKFEKAAVIISPKDNKVFPVDLGSKVEIKCEAVTYSDFDGVFWISGGSVMFKNPSLPVYYKTTREKNAEKIKLTASLVFKKVSEEDLSKNYTCKLESDSNPPSFVTITLVQKTHPSYISLCPSIVAIVVVMLVTVIIYVKLKIDITLFLRDTLGCYRRTSDGKSYDAFVMCYKSNTDAGVNADDRKWLESVLEEKFGYSLCLYDRDVLPGKATAEAVLDCIEQSRTVVLVPTSPDPDLGSGLLSAIHAALVERQTRLIFIKTEATQDSTSGSLAEALQFLSEAGVCVTWKGLSSRSSSSSFWKQLRYYLPAMPKPSPQTNQDVDSWQMV